MRHIFTIEDPKTLQRWKHFSTMVNSGKSEKEGGPSSISKTVGVTSAITARLILNGQIKERGVISPIKPDIYNPVLEELEKEGIKLVEESTHIQPKL